MLTRLHLQNFTVFADADFHFSPGLNVLVGTNGTGKSHVLKVGYAMWDGVPPIDVPHEQYIEPLFLVKDTSHLIRRDAEQAVVLGWRSEHGGSPVHIKIPVQPKTASVHYAGRTSRRIFIPSKEVLSFYKGFVSVYDYREIAFDSTYPDICRLLGLPPLRQLNEQTVNILAALENAMGGTVSIEDGEFLFIPTSNDAGLGINLYAEGLRKFGTLWQLLRNGSLTPETTLFWDEPEANLNPALLKKLAAVLAALARQKFQIILATHSLFLLKELHILSRDKKEGELPIRYFGLNMDTPGAPVRVTAVDDFELLPDIVALDVELQQTVDFGEALDDSYAHD